jgi:zinc D-Ala-D-Ala carboxypeptidase
MLVLALAQLLLACSEPTEFITSLTWVNAERCLDPCGFEPVDLLAIDRQARLAHGEQSLRVRADVQSALQRWLAEAREHGYRVELSSAYRSYEEQERVFLTTFEAGRAARPGHSEHQLGTAIDLRYDSSAAERFLAESASQHGFIQSYPTGKADVTGYPAEPWHFRYVGRETAGLVSRTGLTLEELFRRHGSTRAAGDCARCSSPLSRPPAVAHSR